VANNDERIKALQDGDAYPAKPVDSTQSVNPTPQNNANLQDLQSGDDLHDLHSGTPTARFVHNVAAPVHRNSHRHKWLVWGGIGCASVVGIIITVFVGSSLLSPDSINIEANSGIEVVPEPDFESEIPINQGPPSDIPALAADVTSSTVLVECPNGFGSGFVLDTEPLTGIPNSEVIVTNQHVVEGCEGKNDLIVSTATSMSKGSVIAYDANQDLAIIEAPALTAKPLSIGPIPVIGQWAMAVGNPDGITDTVTLGNITNVKLGEGFILSDVLIGPGNSGGPLVDNQGRVLGVNTAVLIVAEGFSFSVPIDSLCDQLLECR
jgi:S1-C subfamily serine protease